MHTLLFTCTGVIMFCAFGTFGLIPLLGFCVFLYLAPRDPVTRTVNVHLAFLVTCALTLTTLFILGVFKARYANQKPLKSGLMMVLNGGIASSAAYFAGTIFQVTHTLVHLHISCTHFTCTQLTSTHSTCTHSTCTCCTRCMHSHTYRYVYGLQSLIESYTHGRL